MFEFNKRETLNKEEEFPLPDDAELEPGRQHAGTKPVQSVRGTGRGEAAVIGPSIHINGDLHGEEDLIIEGEVKGTVHLKNNSLTIGSHGKVTADVYAHTIFVDGFIEGDIYGAEQISIRKSAQMQGNITAPRVSLEDGARFKGAIEMDPDVSQNVFGKSHGTSQGVASKNTNAAPPASSQQTTTSGSSTDDTENQSSGKSHNDGKNVSASSSAAS